MALQQTPDSVPRSRPPPGVSPRPAETDFERQVDSVVDRYSKVHGLAVFKLIVMN